MGGFVKRKTPGGIWALRAVTIAITVIVLLVVGSIAYSAYEDYNAIRPYLGGGSQAAPGTITPQGSSAIVSFNFTIPNGGLYTLNVTVTCHPLNSDVVCAPSSVNIPPGQNGVLRFKMTVVNVQGFVSSSDRSIPGTVAISLGPFVSLSVGTDFGGFISTGGA